MEVEAHEKKGQRAFAKAIKSFNSSERKKRSKSDLENIYAKDMLYASDKTYVQPKQDGVKARVKSDFIRKRKLGEEHKAP